MSGTSEILQEYLVSLGFKTDVVSMRKFDEGLGATGKRVLKVGGAVAGVVASVEAATAAFAYSMRKMYFQSELSNSTVKNLRAMSYAGKQIGISGDTMAQSIQGMAQAMRLNPGLQGLIESFGVKVSGRDMSDVMIDFVAALKDMPEFAAVQYAGMFGIDPDTYHQMINHMDELKKKKQELLDFYKQSGVDPDKAKKTVLEYTAALDKLQSRLTILGQSMMMALAPAFKETSTWLDRILEGWTHIFTLDWDTFWGRVRGEKKKAAPRKSLPAGATYERPKNVLFSGASLAAGEAPLEDPRSLSKKGSLAALEKQYGLPAGTLYNMWGAESGYGKNMRSPKGAMGHFQFMPATAKEYGLKNPYDFNESSSAAARKMSGLMKRYGGNVDMALAAYNWGEGNIQKHGTQNAPQETVDYVRKITGRDVRLGANGMGGGVNVTQNTTINVNGNGAEPTARAVAREQDRVNGDMTRNMKSAVS